MTNAKNILEISELSLSYGHIDALKNISFTVKEGEVAALLGANGSGKSSLLKAISGLVKCSSGKIRFKGNEIQNMRPEKIVASGLAHCPEGRRIFPDLTVFENLQTGAYLCKDKALFKKNLEKVFSYFPLLADRRTQAGGTLSGGEQQMLALGRSLMSNPTMLMLDEPSLGLAPKMIELIFTIIDKISKEEKVSVLLVEQNANEALLHSSHAFVLETGKLTLSGTAGELKSNPSIIKAYLGG